MYSEHMLAAQKQIKQAFFAGLPRAYYCTAHNLLDYADQKGGLYLSITETLTICRIKALGTLRSHLIALKNVGILEYAIADNLVFIDFLAQPNATEARENRRDSHAQREDSRENRTPPEIEERPTPTPGVKIRAKTEDDAPQNSTKRAKTGEICTPSVKIRAKTGEIKAILPAVGGTIGGVGWDLDPIPSAEESPTTQPATADAIAGDPEGEEQPPMQEQARSMGLLLAVGVMPRNARRLAAAHPAANILRAVAYWWDGAGTKFDLSPGIVVKWLDDWDNAGLPMQFSTRFQASDLYRRFGPRQPPPPSAEPMVVAATATVAEPVAAVAEPVAALWSQIVAEYQPGARVFLDQARLVAITDGRARIQAPRAACDWLRCQLTRRLKNSLAAYGHVVQEVIIQEEGSHASTP